MAAKTARQVTVRERPAQAAPRETKKLDRLIHDRVRLGILSALAAVESMSFADLKEALDLSDGNLSVHARRLEEAGYVACDKTFVGRTPRTEFRLAPAGRRAFEKYLNHMDALIAAARKSQA
jgi:DNA-binding transcriptional ArsR family regulator